MKVLVVLLVVAVALTSTESIARPSRIRRSPQRDFKVDLNPQGIRGQFGGTLWSGGSGQNDLKGNIGLTQPFRGPGSINAQVDGNVRWGRSGQNNLKGNVGYTQPFRGRGSFNAELGGTLWKSKNGNWQLDGQGSYNQPIGGRGSPSGILKLKGTFRK